MRPVFHGQDFELTFDDDYGDEPPESFVFTLRDTAGGRADAEPGMFWFSIPNAIEIVHFFHELVRLHEGGFLDNVHSDLMADLSQELRSGSDDG